MLNLPSDPEDSLARLYEDGFDLVLQGGYLIVRRIPYKSPSGIRKDGKLVLPINENSGVVVDVIGDHTILFSGESPLDERGKALGTAIQSDLGNGETVNYRLSFKPSSGIYESIYDKVGHYVRILRDVAQVEDPTVTATPGAAFQAVEDGLPFVYRDTNTTRSGLAALNNCFRGQTIAIVGVGGTGSYILDQVAKTCVERIILIDGDRFENHNAFRAPGAAAQEVLRANRNKAEYFAEEYSRIHAGIIAHPEKLTMDNLQLLDGVTFAFLAAADASERPRIMAWLHGRSIPFIDVGMGFREGEGGLTGLMKVVAYLPGSGITLPVEPTLQPGNDDYGSNIQVSDLNALNAILAVIRWKRYVGFYASYDDANETIYKLYLNEIRNGFLL